MLNDDAAEKALMAKGIKPSVPRVRIFDYLLGNRNHPTVDDMYRDLLKDIPSLSKTTVYNTVTLFAEEHLVRRVATEDNEARYDACTDDHGHFKCDLCGMFFDFAVQLETAVTEGLEGCEVVERSVYYRGLCPHCRRRRKTNQGGT